MTRQQGVLPPWGSSRPQGSQEVGEPLWRHWGCSSCPCAFPVTPAPVWSWPEPRGSAVGKGARVGACKSVPGRKGSCPDVLLCVTWLWGTEGRKQGDILGAHPSLRGQGSPLEPGCRSAASSILPKLVPPPWSCPASTP